MSYKPDLDRFRFYREMQLWPVSRKLNYENWLNNFEADDYFDNESDYNEGEYNGKER